MVVITEEVEGVTLGATIRGIATAAITEEMEGEEAMEEEEEEGENDVMMMSSNDVMCLLSATVMLIVYLCLYIHVPLYPSVFYICNGNYHAYSGTPLSL